MRKADQHAPIESFYHLARSTPQEPLCQGLACFVARGENPARWKAAWAQVPRFCHLGKCYAGPASGRE
ncbi:MAG: hypothetical protein L0170_10840, partial [Acidobacteria bacterium]|nr:hypothetical protein [Acidobacteriota bacterium]